MFLEKLKEFPKIKTLIIATALTFIPFILITISFIINELALESTSGYGILDLELAWTPDSINEIFTAWGTDIIKRQIFMHYLDYVYLCIYALFGVQCVLITSRYLNGNLQDLGIKFSIIFVLAGIFDALENINLLLMLTNQAFISPLSPFFASLCAIIKISFLVAGLSFLFIAVNILLFKKLRISDKFRYISLIVGGIIFFWLISLWNIFLSFFVGGISILLLILLRWCEKKSF